jgi:mannose-6-phosphate isomerase-like protein (cupin superfamily)
MTRSKLLLALGAALIVGAAMAAEKPVLVKSKDLDAMVAKTTKGQASAQIPTSRPDHIVMMAHRSADGEVEVHTKLADEFLVRTGHATVRVGGVASGQRQTVPNEFRGGKITGGEVYDLGPGDALYIPVGMPHQMMVPKGGDITYTSAKFPK